MKTIATDVLRDTRARLLARAAELRDRLARVRADLRREREPLPRDSTDAAIVVENDDVLQAIEKAAVAELSQIDRAFARMEAGVFTVCEQCGQAIGSERLAAVPYATRCARCEPG